MTNAVIGIKRYLGEATLNAFQKDFSFLTKMVVASHGEYDLQLRRGYVSMYYKGNSMAKIVPRLNSDEYEFRVNTKFELEKAVKERFQDLLEKQRSYHVARVPLEHVHPFFQKKVINKLASKIKSVNSGEEIAFEQSFITDNLGRKDFLIIDRQVSGGGSALRLDLLGLRLIRQDKYRFVLLEVKLGNNKELSGAVADQLERYVTAVRTNIGAFRACYEKNYQEKYQLGLFTGGPWAEQNMPETISIDNEVEGHIVVGSYSGLAEKQIADLLRKYPDLKSRVHLFKNTIFQVQ